MNISIHVNRSKIHNLIIRVMTNHFFFCCPVSLTDKAKHSQGYLGRGVTVRVRLVEGWIGRKGDRSVRKSKEYRGKLYVVFSGKQNGGN